MKARLNSPLSAVLMEVARAAAEVHVPIRITSRADYAEDSVYIQGEFRNCGRYVCTNSMTLANAIDAAGGLEDSADKNRLQIRHPNGNIETYSFPDASQKPSGNPLLFPGDIVVAPPRKL